MISECIVLFTLCLLRLPGMLAWVLRYESTSQNIWAGDMMNAYESKTVIKAKALGQEDLETLWKQSVQPAVEAALCDA